jgi:hypothetical protein
MKIFDVMAWTIIVLIFVLTASIAIGANNSIYITQSGTNLQMTIDQIGNSNVVGTTGTRATFTGGTLSVDIDQVGDSNSLAATVAQGNNTSFTVSTTGDSNVSSITGGGSGDIAGTDFDYAATGDSNVLTFVQGASAAATAGNQDFTVQGTSNDINVSCEVVGCVNSWTVTGDSNDIDTTQTGNANHSITATITGGSNNIDVDQTNTGGSTSGILNIVATTSSGVIDIDQCASGC